MRKYDNTMVICVLDRTTAPKTVIGFVNKITFTNVKGTCMGDYKITPDYQKALKFKYNYTVEILIAHLVSNANPQWEDKNVELIPQLYKTVKERMKNAR